MSFFQAILMGIVQGLTEFLPVSSSGHLALIKNIFGVETDGGILFDVLLHVATLISVCAVYYKDLLAIVMDFFAICGDCFANIGTFFKNLSAIDKKSYRPICTTTKRKLVVMLMISTIPTGIMGVLLDDIVEGVSGNLLVVGLCLIGTGGILFISDLIENRGKKAKEANFGDAMLVGISQGFAVLPGISRSGTTITACLLCGFDRKFAVKYSFIMSVPAILGALILELFKLPGSDGAGVSAGACIVAMILAAVIGYFALRLVNGLVVKRRFKPFWIYCLSVGAIAIIVFLIKLKI
ncbi:MAG: undecaprenyl-diphosphate phosphatase [Lachnospiraceae bacterium]|nr:undecaprenyl-diphosphate phosphatase [Lachnospiraceae bacterium]